MTSFSRDGLTFDAIEAGPPDGEPVLLLHGFPQGPSSWDRLAPLLHAAGYRTIAVRQRGYSPGARPRRRWHYRIPLLIEDAAAAIDQLAGGRAHVVGHDWGAVPTWGVAARYPEKVASLTALSVPHLMAFLRAMVTSRQGLKSWYMYVFQLPLLPELWLRARGVAFLGSYGGHHEADARRDLAELEGPALTGALNWYRALPFMNLRQIATTVRVPALLIYSDGDRFITRRGIDLCERYVTGPYRLEIIPGVSHWMPDQIPDRLADLMLPHLAAAPG